MARWRRVLRPFPGPGGKSFEIGERVDTSGWRNDQALLDQRYLAPAKHSSGFENEPTAPEEPFRGSPSSHSQRKTKRRKLLSAGV